MLSSLHSRLLLTYALVIGVVLCVVGLALIFFIVRNPLVERQVYARLEMIAALVTRQGVVQTASEGRLETAVNRIDEQGEVRVLILSPEGEVLVDSRAGEAARLSPEIQASRLIRRGITQDVDRKAWYTLWEPLGNDRVLVLATQQVGRVSLLFSQRLGEILRDDLFPPLLQGGFAALILALILSFWMANWIAAPLRRISNATRQVAAGEYEEVPMGGPQEVQSLADSFNEMTHRVIASQQSQRDFVANVSHELKTPLTSIQGFSQAILDGTLQSKQEIENAAEVIQTEAGRMHRLVVSLLDLARLEAGTIQMERATIDLDELLVRVVERFKTQAADAEVTLIYERTELPQIVGDGDRLVDVFSNLIDNAIKFTPPGGRVTLRGDQEGDQIRVEVEDSGYGIPQEEISRIFERFYQADKSRAGAAGRGTGLGLAIAKEIVLAHGGSIQVESEAGKGSRFVVKIPFVPLREAAKMKERKKRDS